MAQQDDNIKKLYDELQSTYDVGSEDDFRNYLNNAEHRKALYNELKNDYDIQDEKAFDDYLGYINGEKALGTTKVGSVAQQVVNEYDQSAKDNAEAEEDLSAATSGAKIGGNISFAPAKPNNQQTVQPDVDNTAKSVMDASGTPAEQAKATGPKTQFVPEDPNYVQATPTAEALKKYPWMQPDQVYMWNRTTKEPVVTYVDESGHAVTDEDLQIKKAKSEITGQDDTEYMYPEAAALQLPNGNTTGLKIKKGALTQMADEILRKEYGDNYLNTQFGRDGNVYTGAERRDLGAQQLYDELNSDVRKARISFAVADDKYRNEILSRIKAKWGKVADETSLVNAVNDENAAKQDIDIVAQQNINDLNAEIQNISRQMDQRGAEIDNASSPFVDQTFNARDVDAKYRLLQSKLNYAQNALKSWENVKNSGSLDALAGFKDAVMDISAWDFGFSDLKNSIALLTAKGNDKQELVNLYGRYAEAAKFEDKYNPDSYRYGKIAGTSMPYALQFAGTGGGFKSIGSAVSKKATSIAEKYALEGLKKQVVKGLGVVAGDIARAYTMSGTIQGLNTISDILNRSAGELTVDKQGNYQLKSDEPLLKSIYKGVTASAIENYTEMLGERLNIGGNLMRMLPKIGLGRVSNAITKIGTQDWYRVCNNWLSRAGVNDFGGEVLEEEIGIILNAALVGDNPLFNGSGGLLDVRTQKDILGGMLYSISAMRAGALAMYGVKKGVGSAFIKTLDMYDKMQLNQSDKGGQSIFGEGWAAIKDEIDNTPNEKVNAVIEKLAKEHPSKDEQSAIIDYAVKLLKTRGHNLGIAMASDGENDEGAQEEVQDMPDLSQPNAEYFNKDDGMIHKASLYPDASDPTGTAKDVFIIKGNLVTNEDGSINKDASDDTIIYIDGNGERHIASPDKFAAAYPPMSNDEVRQANEGVAGEGTQTTDTFNKGDEVNINVNGIIYTATIQGTDGSGNYNVYYEDENGMMRPAQFTADQLAAMNSASTASNDKQNMIEQLAGNQQQIEQPAQEQVAQQEQPAQEEQKPAIPTDEKGNMLYHQVPVETTINDLYDGSLDDNEIRDFVDANISEADKNLEKVNKKAPKIGTNKDEYLKKKQEWQKQVEDATRIRDYWNSVKDYIAQQTHTTPEDVKAAQDELSGEAARREYQDMGGSVQQDAVSVASDFIRGAKITPESFKAETGYGTDEQRKFVGMIAKAEKGGKTIDRLAEELVSYDNAEMNGVQFGGDTSSAKDAILSALQGAGTRGELKQTNEAEEQAYIDARNAARDEQYMEQYGMTYEEYLAYEEQIMPTIWREYNNYDEVAFNNMYAEEIEQLIKSIENDTTGEEQADDRGNQVLPEQQVTEQRGSTGSQEQRTEAPVGVQGNNENAVAPEEASGERIPNIERGRQGYTGYIARRQQNNLETSEEINVPLSQNEQDEYGNPMVLAENGSTVFGTIESESGLTEAPIKLSLGENKVGTDGKNHGYGLLHIEAGHGEQIRNAGYQSVEQFVENVAQNYTDIKEGALIGKKQTYLLEVSDEHNNTLFIQLSNDGTYWNVNSAGIFKKKYSRRKPLIYTVPAVGKSTVTDTSEVNSGQSMGATAPAGNSSESKDSDKSAVAQTIDEKIAKAEEETDVNPTEGQKEAGNYKKGHVCIDGYDITIEQPKGSVRRGTDADGKQWEQTMNNTYGYIRGTEGVDGDHIDIFLSDNPTEGNVYVVDQVNPDGSFDEHKVMYGFNSAEDARAAYLSNYEEGWQGLGTITEVSKDEFKKWVNSSKRKTKPFAEYKSVNAIGAQNGESNILYREANTNEEINSDELISTFARKHNLNKKYVEDYANYMRRGNLNGASRAFKEIRREVRLDNQVASLGQFIKIFSPIKKELYELFGNVDELRQQFVQRTLDERNAMETARKKAEEAAEAERRRLQILQGMTDEQLDSEYVKAVEANDEIRMRDLVNEAARRNGYGDTGSEYQGVGAWSAPGNPGYESDEKRREAVANDAPDVNITDIANGYSSQPADYFTNLRAYGTDTPHGRESAKAINNAIDEVKKGKDPMVKVYRAVPKSIKEGNLRNGDWVTPSRKYAEMHGDNRLEGDYRIIEQEVPAGQIWWDGNDINEWGFDDGKGYAYRNTKNNRKLNDPITRDDNGNIIPLSQRFNARKSDIRYRFIGEQGAANLDAAEEATTRLDNLSVAREMENAYNEKKARIEKLKDSKPVDVKYNGEYDLNRKPAKDWLKENVRGEYTNNDTGEKIGISKVGINEVTSHGSQDKAHLKSLIAIPQMIEQSIFIDEIPNTKDHDKYDSYKYYVCGLKIDDVDYIVKLVVGVKGDNKYYDHRLTEIEKGTLIDNLNGLSNSVAENQNANISYGKDTKLQSILQTNDRENARKIKFATGWERGADGMWRYETADFEYYPKGDARRNDSYKKSDWYNELHGLEEKLFNGETLTDEETRRFDELSARVNAIRDNDKNTERIYLDDYVKDEELFKAYPELKQTKIDFVDLPNERYSAKYNEKENRITVNQAKSIDDKSAIAHEVQHAIQHIEGFAQGGNGTEIQQAINQIENKISDILKSDEYKKAINDFGKEYEQKIDKEVENNYSDLEPERKQAIRMAMRDDALIEYKKKSPVLQRLSNLESELNVLRYNPSYKSSYVYNNLSGEVEARNVEARINMPLEERRRTLAEETEDVAREDQIFLQDALGASERYGTYGRNKTDGQKAEEANRRFNEELQQQIDGTLPKGHVYELGRPSGVLRSAGIPNLPIELAASRLSGKSKQDNHPFDMSEVMDLPKAIQNPMAVFRSATHIGSYVVMTEIEHNGKNFVVAIEANRKKGKIEINDIRSIHYRTSNAHMANWISEGLLEYVDKEKMAEWFSKQRYNSAEVRKLFNHAANIVKNFENPNVSDENMRQGIGALTDSELSNANDPAGKMLGKPSRTPAQQKAFAERERQRMADRAREVADILHLDNVEIVTDASTLQGRRAKAKGFYSRDNGKIVIVVPNHVDMADIEQTVLHEAVAHYGLRKLFGSNFDTFLYNVYNNADMDVREKISQLAAQHNWNFATATEEYLASLAEKTNFENLNASWWDKIKSLFLKLLHSIGLKGFTGVSLSDNELRYILWRSYENLKNPGRYRSIIDEAKDITMQNELRVGNYSAGNSEAVGKAAENGVVNIEDVNRRFNEELGRLTEENAQSVILNLGRPGNFLLASGLSDRPIKLYGNKLLKKMRKHGFTTSDVKNLPKEINNPIAVFKGSVENSFAILTELEINGNNVLASISVGKGNDIDFNIISSVYGKNGNSVVSWINDGKILYVNKEKALNYLRISAPIAEAQDNQELSSAANIVKNFENPNISEENMRYGNGALAASESNGINKTNETNGQEAEEANRRFNEELNAFKAKTHKGLLHLGQPGRILNACGINEELTLSPTVLSRKLKQHGLNVDDIKGLAGAIQEPILVYQHGDAHPNMVIVTDLAAKGGKVSVAVELDGEGNVVELNNVSSVHSKGATTELERLSNMRDGYLEQALRWVDKNKVSDWLGIADLNSPIHANNPKLVSIANILQNFENPSVGEENILYREAKKVEKKINSDWRDEYDKKLSKFSFKLTEAAQDAMRSVKILQDIIAKETSAPIRDDENVYWRENRLSSVNKYEQEYYNENYCKPIVTEIANLVKYGARYNDKGEDIINSDNDVLKYLIAKSGLERNQSKREVEAMNARKPYEDQIKELQKQVEKEEIKEENANKKIAKLQEQADKAEMNKRVAVLHKDYSGLTELFQDEKDFDTLATSYVSDFEKKFDTESLWNAINRATKETLRKAFVDGLISRESYESTAKMYKYYIPLRGWANDVASEAYNYKGSGEGSRKILQTAKGRTSLADNPISEIGRMMQDAIFQGNRNRMKQAVYNLAMNHDTSLLNIKRQWYQNMGTEEDPAWERVFPDLNSDMTAEQVAEEVEEFESRMRELKKEGRATQSRKGLILRLHTTKREEAQHRISVAINGKEYNIFVNGNPRAAQAINGELNDVDRYGSAVAKVNRFLSQVYTSINPEFVVTNYQRDAGFAASIVASTEPWSYQKEWAKNMTVYNPITTGVYLNRLIKKAKTGNINPSNKAERYMQEFLSHGGETGFTNMLSADDYKKQIKRDIKSINSVVSLSKASRAAVAFTERANTVFEDATRYATYVTSREQGRTIDRSIRDAKEISLNFNTRGADGLPGDGFIYRFFRGLRRWMIFVNPSIQGLNKAGMAFRNHPLRSSMMIAGLPTLLGYALPAIMRAVVGGGDGDDDDKNVVESYKDLPKWVRRTNIAIPIGGNNFVTIPLSYELRVSYGLGEMMWEYGEGMIDKDEVATETVSQLSDLLPISFSNGTVAQSISPSIARPLIDVIQNRNFYGKKIYNDSQFIEGYPEYMKAYAGTPKWLVKSTEVLNNVIPNLNAGVSDKYTPGAINVNPAIIDYLLSSYLGGLYNFPSKFGKAISMIWDEDMRDIQNVPMVSRNWKNSQSGNPYNSGDRYKTYMKEYDLSKQRFNGYKKEAEHDVPEFLKSLNDLLDTPSGKRMLMIDAYKRDGLDKLNRRIRDIDTYGNEKYEGEKDALTKRRDGLKEELINKLDSISDGTLDFVNGEWTRK